MEHAKGLQLHNIAIWDARYLPTKDLWSYLGVGVMRGVCGLECEGCDDNDGDDAIVVDDVVVTTGDRGVDNEIDDVGMALDDTA